MAAMLRSMLVLALATLSSACGVGAVEPDAGGDDIDSGGDMGALELRWIAPDVDQQLGPVRIDRLRLSLRDLQVIGDASPTDTYQAAQDLQLDDGGGKQTTGFSDAPPGRYSSFEFAIERRADGDASWTMEGTVEVGGDTHDLEVEDQGSTSVSLPLAGLALAAGETAVITIEVAIAAVVADVDWDSAPLDDGTVVVDDDSPLLAGMRQRLRLAFSVSSIEID